MSSCQLVRNKRREFYGEKVIHNLEEGGIFLAEQ
jgi:hypothetical protein